MAPEIIKEEGHTKTVDWWSLGALIYEMLFGQSPFYNSNQSEMFNKISEVQYIMPDEFSNEAKDIIEKLLEIQPKHRLGHGKTGTDDVKSHPFFQDIDWDDLENNR